ncbi:NAD(P)/FAD-dependent oxidoreductase [Salisediminibacterium selenitireducens]|uniref:FAD dependent oxidoreductase n=1 Tax=Bacillus selenitireducens (strain ATCC 700615 / DSM 15326 / MLS10) TaxID=439292 RepID=D6XYX7_BACIE|nr:FAD-dependent oxidoreductase [Salisediminibacterium selenitireducens]ADH98285.1 FAD dependent oxidoreductase [[Bacillus] selenitireducens MLS10]
MTRSIGIVGAGLTGLTAAHHLKEAGCDVTVFEKSKSPGGRMATRRVGDGKMDHGAVFFTVRSEAFQTQVDTWLKDGQVRRWFGEEHPRYTGTEGMNPLMKHYATYVNVTLNTKITDILYQDQQVTLIDQDNIKRIFDAVILTAPLPQTMELISGTALPLSQQQRKELQAITFEPCYVGLFELKEAVTIGEHGLLDETLPKGIMKIVANDQKGISSSPKISVYMDGTWSKAHDKESEADILSDILNRFKKTFPDRDVQITGRQLKRWRYSQAESLYPDTYVKLEHLPVYLAGDSFVHPDDPGARSRVESAYLSGTGVCKALLDT